MVTRSQLTIALEPAVSAQLDVLAQREGRNAAELAAAAVAEYVALDTEHVVEIEAALREADAGDFAADAEVAAVFARWMPIGLYEGRLAAHGPAQYQRDLNPYRP